MNHYRWNMLNNFNDLVFVIHAETREIVLKNNVFDELVAAITIQMGKEVADFMPQKPGCDDMLTDVQQRLADGSVTEYQETIHQVFLDKTIEVQVNAGYFNDEKTEVYFVLKGYHSIIEFIRLGNSLSKVPENILLLELDDALTIYCTNEEFEKNFSTPALSFAAKCGNSFVNAMEPEMRAPLLQQIHESLAVQGRSGFVMEITTVAGNQHYAMVSMKEVCGLLNRTMLCATLQIADDSVAQYLKLQDEHEVYSVASHFSNSVLFRINLVKMTAAFFGELADNFDLRSIQGNFVEAIIERNLVFQDDVETFHSLLNDMRNGVENIVRMRMHAKDGRCDWYMVEYKIVTDANGVPQQALGKITNVQKNQELQEKASLDLLTSCINKGTFESYCMNLLSDYTGEETHAFFIIDIDNFKAVNDNLGHFFGDIVLKEIAAKLKRIFRASDYIARIGGDEFAVLMKDIKDNESVYRKASELIQAVDVTYRGNNTSYRISASVGIAMYPSHADNYEDIYKRADVALYRAKNTGKNAYKVYDDSLLQGTMANTTPFDVANRAFSHFFDQQVAMDTFNLLFEATNNHDALEMVLRHLGERFGVDRCYIFAANNPMCTAYDNTCEWCRDGVSSEIDHLQNVSYEAFNGLFAQANEEGVFYCDDVSALSEDAREAKDVLEAQGIVSLLHTYVRKDGLVKYALGFDDCTAKRLWKPSEISTLMYASKIIAQYLLYTEAMERATANAREQLEVMDRLNFHAYIVDNDTHHIHYVNNLTKAIIPNIQQGDICYEVIRGKTSECENCPLKTLRENHANKTRSIIHNEVLGMDFLVTASVLDSFGGKACTFVSSTDISDVVSDASLSKAELAKYKKFSE